MTDSLAPSAPRPKRKSSMWRELVETAVLTVAIFLAVRIALQNFKVEGESMTPNLQNGEYILVNKIDYRLHAPERGDIVVFQAVPALQPDRDFIKRVIGLPGDTVAVHGGSVYLNGHRLREPYINALNRPDYVFPSRKVPPGDYFVLGDHRNDSYDSAKWTSTPWLARKYIIGKAWIAYWPLNDLTYFHTPSFASP